MRKAFVAFLALAAAASVVPLAYAGSEENPGNEPGIVRAQVGPVPSGNGQSSVATGSGACLGNNPAASCDTVWVGHAAGTYLGVNTGTVWNFDDDIAGTDSTQGWRR